MKGTCLEDFSYAVIPVSGSLSWNFHSLCINFNVKLIQRKIFVQMGYYLCYEDTQAHVIYEIKDLLKCLPLHDWVWKLNFLIIICPRVVVSKVLNPHHCPFCVGHNPKPTWHYSGNFSASGIIHHKYVWG